MDIVLKHATEILAEAKVEAESIAQKARVEHAAKQGQAAPTYTEFQPSRVS